MDANEPCPKCRAKGADTRGDNLHRYPDGHGYCFACHYVDFPESFRPEKESIASSNEPQDLALPKDATDAIDFTALQWLTRYDITMEEVRQYKMMWSPKQQFLIFPIYQSMGWNDMELYPDALSMKMGAWQARTFNSNWKAKYYNVGPLHDVFTIFNLIGGDGNFIVVVEDMLSAIRVARKYAALPMFGSMLTMAQLHHIKDSIIENIIFWLDEDKCEEGMQMAKQATQLGFGATFIVTKHDPKDYEDVEINEIIRQNKLY